jgi:hypothetical protein
MTGAGNIAALDACAVNASSSFRPLRVAVEKLPLGVAGPDDKTAGCAPVIRGPRRFSVIMDAIGANGNF